MTYVKGPWKCAGCGKVFESLDKPAAGHGEPGKEPEYYCIICCPPLDSSDFDMGEDDDAPEQ